MAEYFINHVFENSRKTLCMFEDKNAILSFKLINWQTCSFFFNINDFYMQFAFLKIKYNFGFQKYFFNKKFFPLKIICT